MAETKEITKLFVVTDSETSFDNIGDIDGGMFNEVWLKSYVKFHGTHRLIEKLAEMQMQVLQMKYEIINESDSSVCAANI